jgi:hypothetical protein
MLRPRVTAELRDFIRSERDRIVRDCMARTERAEREIERLIARRHSKPDSFVVKLEELRPDPGRAWTRESIVEAIIVWRDEHGHWPTYQSWRRSKALPSTRTILRHFGRWSLALEAARGPNTCRRGHLLAGDNVMVDRDGRRRCRPCREAAWKRSRDRVRARRSRQAAPSATSQAA